METSFQHKPLTIGQKIERIRIFRGIKQETLAAALKVSQQQVSIIEQQTAIEDELLKQIAEILGVTPEIIKNFDEERIIYNINNVQNNTNTVTDNSFEQSPSIIGQVGQQINPIEKIEELYERLLKSERENQSLREKLQKQNQ